MARSLRVGERFFRSAARPPLVLGHRGARHAAPENTFRAFELARAEGAEGVELDVRLDGSGEIVVLHDPTLARVTQGENRARVDALSTEQLRALDLGHGERIPRLVDVLAWAREHDQLLNVEVKADQRSWPALVRAVVAQLARSPQCAERVLLSSFHPLVVTWLARRLPDFPVCWLVHGGQRVLRSAPGFRRLGAIGVNPEHTLLEPERVASWKRNGALLATWTVNDPERAVHAAALGVDAIITDRPGAVRAALHETVAPARPTP
ncbi:MAG TPA: glycerophosphodiester phosphodiesterase family protein [Polyangiaceae bacterium]|nr:MAG: glycerophosphodiester phosphodiesterase [Pseudomonadota bacterium]HLV65207.1 glycerophosphodiester phosphodiesterase family protein [Polyangiaceae bacterium]